jgi:hypothetical protein
VTIRNSIIADNHAQVAADISGPLVTSGYNLIQDTTGAALTIDSNGTFGPAPDVVGLAAMVGPLHDNGGSTQTLALQPGSPAINRIPRQYCFVQGIFTDQRGVRRPDSANGTNCDIGAYQTGT